jgi:hypothetical protein
MTNVSSLKLLRRCKVWICDWLEVLVSVMHCSRGYGFTPELNVCDPIDEHSGDHKQRM